jgi:transglutaminase-like putative cysteine protease
MKLNVFSELIYTAWSPGTIILNIHALRTPHQTVIDETLTIEPYIRTEELVLAQGESRMIRFEVANAREVKITYKATIDNLCEIKDFSDVTEVAIARMDPAVLHYLHPSRYCQSDKLLRLAYSNFGYINNPFEKVATLTNWINKNIQYLSGVSTAQTSAYDTVTEQAGVCRDFAHLGIALCRALTIPARYFTGYAYQLNPADFHACFEAYIGKDWVLFDPTKLVPLNGLIKIASGRDAADTAIASIFGNVTLKSMQVSCELADNGFIPFYYEPYSLRGLSYL